jgi:hypothetical protein
VRGGGERSSGLESRSIRFQIIYTRYGLPICHPSEPTMAREPDLAGREREARMTNRVRYAQGRKSRPLDIDRGVREQDRFDPSSLDLHTGRTAAIRRDRGKEVVDSGWFPAAGQMKEDGVGGRGRQVTL